MRRQSSKLKWITERGPKTGNGKRKACESGMKHLRDYLLAGGIGLIATIRQRRRNFYMFSRLARAGVGGKDMVAYSGQL